MSLRGTIRRPDNRPLGTVEEVKRGLSDAFPGVRFVYQEAEPPGLAEAEQQMSFVLRLWQIMFGTKMRYPNYHGYFESGSGGSIEFYFEAEQPVRWITATSYGLTGGLGANFDRLFSATGWKVSYPRF